VCGRALKRADLQLKVIKESFKELEGVSRKVMDMVMTLYCCVPSSFISLQQNDESQAVMEAAKQKGEDMRSSVDTLRRQLTQQVMPTLRQYISHWYYIGKH